MTDAGEQANQVLADFLRVMSSGDSLINGAVVQRSWTSVENGAPIIYVVYWHPWWPFPTGLRWNLEDQLDDERSDTWSKDLAEELAHSHVGEPLGTESFSMVPDSDGVWWWGDDPLPGDQSRRGRPPTESP